MRKEYIKRAIETALDPDGNFELARKIVEEHVTDPDDQKEMTEQIEEKLKAYTFESGKIEDATASLMSLESDAERAYRLADLAGRASKNGNKKLAAELLEKALGYLPQPIETRDEYGAMIRIIYNSVGVDRERSFETFDSLIEPINQLVTATIQYKRYKGKRSDQIRDEILLRELRRDFPAKGFVDVIVPLSRADFDRTINLAERIRQPELRLHIKLLAIREAATE